MKLLRKISQGHYRPPIRETWNPMISILITSCWSDDATVRPSLGQVISSIAMIMKGKAGLITALTTSKDKVAAQVQATSDPARYLAPGALWHRVQTAPTNIVLGEVL